MEKLDLKYFLGTNSCQGFISAFGNSYNAADGWKAYIIKGGPGTGKSSFMKYIAVKAVDSNIKPVLCPCSSDPESLDAVILPQLKTVIMDGTSPHTVDPVYPGVCERILNFGDFWENRNFQKNGKEIINLTAKNKALHHTASRYLQAAGQLIKDNFNISLLATDKEKTINFAKKLCRKYIPKRKGEGYEWERYLCSITPKGIVSYSGTVFKETNNAVIIEDEYAGVSDIIMRVVREWALSSGYEIITVKNAFLPNDIIDHIIIPELSLSFVREYAFQHFACDTRRIHARRFMSLKQINSVRSRLRFNKKLTNQLLLSAVGMLKEAKTTHDMLEKHYISEMDFKKQTVFAEKFANELFLNQT